MTRIPSVMPAQSRFSTVPNAEIPRSSFDRSHGYKSTFNAGDLVPIFVDEALPGDTFSLNMTGFARLATPLHPFMDNVFMNTFFFAVPIRLLWENWEKFNGAQENPGDSTDYLVPVIEAPASTGFAAGSIFDYMGIPTGVDNFAHSALWARAYNQIYNEWFRDENLQDSVPVHKGDGPDPASDYTILKRGKRHDYFTSCLPWPQKGESVDVPIGTTAPVTGSVIITGDGTLPTFSTQGGVGAQFSNQLLDVTGSSPQVPRFVSGVTLGGGTKNVRFGDNTGLEGEAGPDMVADLSEASAATINMLRQAFQIQKLYERDARGGTRYTEVVRAHIGVTSPDARLQRPE